MQNDLISRKALIEDLMNLEVVGGHKMYWKGCDHTLHGLVPEIVNAQPAVDAVPVVRCRDCVFCATSKASMEYGEGYCREVLHHTQEFPIKLDGFCSYGKRKADG